MHYDWFHVKKTESLFVNIRYVGRLAVCCFFYFFLLIEGLQVLLDTCRSKTWAVNRWSFKNWGWWSAKWHGRGLFGGAALSPPKCRRSRERPISWVGTTEPTHYSHYRFKKFHPRRPVDQDHPGLRSWSTPELCRSVRWTCHTSGPESGWLHRQRGTENRASSSAYFGGGEFTPSTLT